MRTGALLADESTLSGANKQGLQARLDQLNRTGYHPTDLLNLHDTLSAPAMQEQGGDLAPLAADDTHGALMSLLHRLQQGDR